MMRLRRFVTSDLEMETSSQQKHYWRFDRKEVHFKNQGGIPSHENQGPLKQSFKNECDIATSNKPLQKNPAGNDAPCKTTSLSPYPALGVRVCTAHTRPTNTTTMAVAGSPPFCLEIRGELA